MKNIFMKLIAGVLIICLCSFCFAACTRDKKDEETTNTTEGMVDDSDGKVDENNGTDRDSNGGVVGDIMDGGESIVSDVADGAESVLDDAGDMIDGKDTENDRNDSTSR